MTLNLEILHEDNHLLVLCKPAMIPTMGTGPDQAGLVGMAREYIRVKYQKPGKVFLGIVSRLDSWVSGAIVFARTSKSAARLSEQFRTRTIQKTYWAIIRPLSVSDDELPMHGTLEHMIGKNELEKRMAAVAPGQPAGTRVPIVDLKQAKLDYRTLISNGSQRLIEINLITGRKHQIRAQFSAMGWPILGDRKYGSKTAFPTGIALHSRLISFEHPTLRERMDFRAKLPLYWPEFAKKHR